MGASRDVMLSWLAITLRDARIQAGRKQVHIAAEANMDQASINRFEQGRSWPRDVDRIVAAYARDLNVEPRELWRAALDRWDTAERR